MRILSWVQNKLRGGPVTKRFNAGGAGSAHYASMPDAQKEEFNDWPQALLAIGTFGNNELNKEEQPKRDDPPQQNLDSSEDLSDFTAEEVNKLQKELKELLSRKSKSKSSGSEMGEEDRANLPLNRFLNCPSSLEVDRTASAKFEHSETANHGDLSPNTKIILNKVKDMLLGNRNAIKKKSVSFLLKKMFACGGGFPPAPSLRDPMPESRMEKILREILPRKMCQQSPAPTSSKKRLENTPIEKAPGGEEDKKKSRCKWVKTDSEFIVLEI